MPFIHISPPAARARARALLVVLLCLSGHALAPGRENSNARRNAAAGTAAPTPNEPPKVVTLNLTVTVTNGQTGNPVPNAKILIPRKGKNSGGQTLRDINGVTNANGIYTKSNVDFELTGSPHKVLISNQQNTPLAEKVLSDDDLLAAFKGKNLPVDIEVGDSRKPPPNVAKLGVDVKVTVKEGGAPLRGASVVILPPDADGRQARPVEVKENQVTPGTYSTPITEFLLTGTPHRLVVNGGGFAESVTDLTDEELLAAAAAGNLARSVELTKSEPTTERLVYIGDLILRGLGLLSLAAFTVWVCLRVYRYARGGEGGKSTTEVSPKSAESGGDTLQLVLQIVTTMRDRAVTKEDLQAKLDAAVEKILNGQKAAAEAARASSTGTTGYDGSQGGAGSWPNSVSGGSVGRSDATWMGGQQTPPMPERYAGAEQGYLRLAAKQPQSPGEEPCYLEVEESSSIAGKLEDSTVYLRQVGNSQGALVLFRDGSDSGWVYPNPTIGFRRAAVKDVFPKLTDEFDGSRDRVAPKLVTKVGDNRWRVEDGSSM